MGEEGDSNDVEDAIGDNDNDGVYTKHGNDKGVVKCGQSQSVKL